LWRISWRRIGCPASIHIIPCSIRSRMSLGERERPGKNGILDYVHLIMKQGFSCFQHLIMKEVILVF
jgi:hypothetical protein